MHEKTGDDKYLVGGGRERMLTWEDLLGFRNIGGLPGHVEMAEKNLFVQVQHRPQRPRRPGLRRRGHGPQAGRRRRA